MRPRLVGVPGLFAFDNRRGAFTVRSRRYGADGQLVLRSGIPNRGRIIVGLRHGKIGR